MYRVNRFVRIAVVCNLVFWMAVSCTLQIKNMPAEWELEEYECLEKGYMWIVPDNYCFEDN